jgi:hypothetical protein
MSMYVPADEIRIATAEFIASNPTSFSEMDRYSRKKVGNDFISLLGCPVEVKLVNGVISIDINNAPSEHVETIRECLPSVMRHAKDYWVDPPEMAALLTGIARYDCWQSLLDSEDYAYHLVEKIVYYVGDYWDGTKIDVFAKEHVCSLLNTWLKPLVPWCELPGMLSPAQDVTRSAPLPDDVGCGS